ncbi:MAG: PKD-like domain-containing protein [Spirosomataceae bacterium]
MSGAPITFSGPTSGTTFAWSSSGNIGFGTAGSGNISSFNVATVTSANTATVTVTPTANGCLGTSRTFTITVNPIPL